MKNAIKETPIVHVHARELKKAIPCLINKHRVEEKKKRYPLKRLYHVQKKRRKKTIKKASREKKEEVVIQSVLERIVSRESKRILG